MAGIVSHQGHGCSCFVVGQVGWAVEQGDVVGNMALEVLQISKNREKKTKKKNAPFSGKAVRKAAPVWLAILCE